MYLGLFISQLACLSMAYLPTQGFSPLTSKWKLPVERVWKSQPKIPSNFLLGVTSTVMVAWFFLRESSVHSTVVGCSPLGSSVVWLILLAPLWKSTTVSSFPLRTTLLLLPVVVMMKVSNSGQLLFTSSLLPISCMMVASIVFLLMSLKNLGRK